jgi:hypothetical protein
MADMGNTKSNALSEKNIQVSTAVTVSAEYEEYLGLCEIMTEEKVKKLVRKIE